MLPCKLQLRAFHTFSFSLQMSGMPNLLIVPLDDCQHCVPVWHITNSHGEATQGTQDAWNSAGVGNGPII